MERRLARAPRRALVIKLGHIGDVLVTTPVIAALHRAFPGVEVTAVVNQGTEDMLRHNPQVSRLRVVRRDLKGLAGLAEQAGLLAGLWREHFDLSLELSGGDRGAWLSLAGRAKLRVGFEPKKPHMRARAFHLLVDQRGTQDHVVRTFLRQIRAIGVEPSDDRLRFEPGPAARHEVARLLADHGLRPGRYVALHPTSRWMFKSWTPEGNAAVAEHLLGLGLDVALSAAPAPAEMAFVARLKDILGPRPGLVDLSGRLDLLGLGALIDGARLFFGVDSAPMHMAAALGRPTAVLFGPSGEKMWGPWRVESEVITGDCPQRPCGRDGCDGSKISRCLVEIAPARVCQALDGLLARTESSCASA
ncbi:lipopolysaccharide heptosyltransferase III [Desulfarculus baarsii DSM 2075]|uniref:Lipopolysaccharide heptosyltransferase III n=1 Tax=Desulfarculus baarsii (strain ATCC 33931 / DSM 2075 / LMG 7858 / VKM B-1802 / 2st14) TaxID=644282 RepID=E1QID6_DESB2|nr:putative lipopolysaccharide heptosyltransferase III [Desulfarculus baarsii]ADK85453.1 lipopolysaccharide heptosyltransferase III [Desulfarculus baarsii DSM 2075]